jgi:sugar (pentulose or hexulose) kinase
MTDAALGIDVGTSGVRIAALDRSGRELAMSAAPIVAPLQEGLRILQDPAIWWDALRQAFAALDLAGHTVRAIAVDGTSGTILPVDQSGRPLDLASMYNDLAEKTDIDRIAAIAPQETAALGGSSPLARAIPMQRKISLVRILHQADWIAGRLCGHFDVTDENNALKTGYDPVSRSWPAWIAKTEMNVKLLPDVVPAGTAIGTILASAADEFRIPRDVRIVAGTTDGCAAFLASGAGEAGDGVTSLGSTLTLKLLSAKPVFAPQYGIYSHRIGDQWLAGGASNTGGNVLAQFFTRDEIARLTPLLDPSRSTGLDYYPLAKPGERFPINDPARPPRLTPTPDDRRIFFQAILEGIAAVEALGYRRLAELGATRLKSVRSVGGGAANTAWTAIRLKALGVIAKPALSEQAAVGAARLAWRGLGHAN